MMSQTREKRLANPPACKRCLSSRTRYMPTAHRWKCLDCARPQRTAQRALAELRAWMAEPEQQKRLYA
jgi:hypothetical protein